MKYIYTDVNYRNNIVRFRVTHSGTADIGTLSDVFKPSWSIWTVPERDG